MLYLAKYSVEIIPLRGEFVNIPCLLRTILKWQFWSGNPIQAHVDTFIEAVSPKVVITVIDNNANFYTIHSRFPDIKTIFFQNGVRGGSSDALSTIAPSDKCHVDYMFVFSAAVGKMYQKYISGTYIAGGSLRNNAVKKSNEVSNCAVLFISQYRDKPENNLPFAIYNNGREIYWNEFYAAETETLNFLSKWCARNNRSLQIAAASLDQQCDERDFYAARLTECSWDYIPRVNGYSSYKLVGTAEIVVSIDSTLGYESIALGKKTAVFSCRGTILNDKSRGFSWPAALPENGPFWTNEADEKQFQRIMDYLNTVDDEEWEQTRQLYASEIMEFDPGNKRFVALLDQLLPKTRINSPTGSNVQSL